MRKIDLDIFTFSIKESGINDNRYGLFNYSTNSWLVKPIMTYSQASNFDIAKLLNSINVFKEAEANRILKSKKVQAKVRVTDSIHIEEIKNWFNVKNVKDACLNYNSELCYNSTNRRCINCIYRFIDWESLEEKEGGYNE